MENNRTTLKWSELYGRDVAIPGEGKTVGKVEDFYVQEGTNAIYALRVRTRLYGDLSLPVTGIRAIEKDRVTIPNAQMLAKALPPFLLGKSLLARKLMDGNDHELGTVKDVIIGIDPPVAMRVSGLEIARRASERSSRIITADGVAGYPENIVTVFDHVAKSLR